MAKKTAYLMVHNFTHHKLWKILKSHSKIMNRVVHGQSDSGYHKHINSAVLYKAAQIETNKVQLSKMVVIDVFVAPIGLANFATLIVITKKARFNIFKIFENFQPKKIK